MPRGTATGVSVLLRGGGDRDLELAMVIDTADESSPSVFGAGAPYEGKAFLNIRQGNSPPPAGSFITEGSDGTEVDDVAGDAGTAVKPLAGAVRTGSSDTVVALEVSFPEPAPEVRSINYEDIPSDSRDFSFRIVVRSGSCREGSERSVACQESQQSVGPFSFRAVDLVDPP